MSLLSANAPIRRTSVRKSHVEINGVSLLRIHHQDRTFVTRLPATYADLERVVRRLFGLHPNAVLAMATEIEQYGQDKVDIDPEIWNDIKGSITAVWTRVDDFDVDDDSSEEEEDTDPEFFIFLKNPTGPTRTIEVKGTDTVALLKEKIEARYGILIDLQRILFLGRQLDDSDTMSGSKICPDSTLHVYIRMRGGKPVIYLFTPTPVNAQILLHLSPSWSFSAIYPVSKVKTDENSEQEVIWDVRVKPDGTMTDKASGCDVSYLYWEAETNAMTMAISPPPSRPSTSSQSSSNHNEFFDPARPKIMPVNSALLPIANLPGYLDKVLLALGFHTEARTSFITYWLPSMLKHPYVALRFLPQEVYELAARLTINPEPISILRVFMLWKGVPDCEVKEGEWNDAVKKAGEMKVEEWKRIIGMHEDDSEIEENQVGLKVLEWGGMEVKG